MFDFHRNVDSIKKKASLKTPLALPQARISGPVSLHAFNVPCLNGGTNSVLLMGDVHHSEENQCGRCKEDASCATLVELIESLELHCIRTGVSFDVFMEFPYVVREGYLRDAVVDATSRMFEADRLEANSTSKPGPVRAMAASVVGMSSFHIGVFSGLFEKFGHRFYGNRDRTHASHASHALHAADQSRTGAPLPPRVEKAARGQNGVVGNSDAAVGLMPLSDPLETNVRYHYSDARKDPNVWVFVEPPLVRPDSIEADKEALLRWVDDFHVDVPDSTTHRQLMEAFLYSTDFPSEMRRVFGPNANVVDAALSSLHPGDSPPTIHKIAKQFHKLDPRLQPIVKNYIDARLDELTWILDEEIGYDQAARQMADPEATLRPSLTDTADEMMQVHRDLRLGSHIPNFVYFASLLNPVVLMDAYLLCRLLRYATAPSSAGGYTVVYAGDSHIEYYAAFFEKFMGIRPTIQQLAAPTSHDYERCIHVSARR